MAGYKTWAIGEVVEAGDFQSYIQDQAVMVFASAAARTLAIGTPTAGMMSYLTDVAQVQVYGGTAVGWTAITGGGGDFTSFLLMGA